MEDKLVVGRRAIGDGLKDMERFAGNESEVVFPEWKQKLFDRMKFECGRVAIRWCRRQPSCIAHFTVAV